MASLTAALRPLFDRVYVVSLPRSADRRAHIRAHFAEIGLSDYTFFDALDAQSDPVAEAFRAGQVHPYPPCFRCGRETCGNPNCNNVLIPPQVANVLTYRRLWQTIAAQPQRALVVEDDVLFHAWAASTLEALASVDLGFEPGTPRLLRFGWALGPDHVDDAPFRIVSDVRMSNPCYGLTSAYARALLDRGGRIDTTSDVFTHSLAPKNGEAFTVLPPVASELSWSTGAVASLIHPKALRSEFLRAQGDEAAAADNDRRIRDHRQHATPPELGASQTEPSMRETLPRPRPMTSLERWKSPGAFAPSWLERNQAMFGLFEAHVGSAAGLRFSEYGCGPNAPFASVVAEAGRGETVCYDFKVWDRNNRLVDLNAPPFDILASDVGVLSGVLEYLNDVASTLRALARFHTFLLVSYAIFDVAPTSPTGERVSRLDERCARHGWRNHFELADLVRIVSGVGYIERIRTYKEQVIALVKTVNSPERT